MSIKLRLAPAYELSKKDIYLKLVKKNYSISCNIYLVKYLCNVEMEIRLTRLFVYAEWNFPPLSIGTVQSYLFKGMLGGIFRFRSKILTEHSASKR